MARLPPRKIASNSAVVTGGTDGVWYINTAITYDTETWTAATSNDRYDALAEAINATPINRMDSATMNAVPDTAWPALTDTFDIAIIVQNGSDQFNVPQCGQIDFNYTSQTEWIDNTQDYTVKHNTVGTVEITSPAAGGPRNAKVAVMSA